MIQDATLVVHTAAEDARALEEFSAQARGREGGVEKEKKKKVLSNKPFSIFLWCLVQTFIKLWTLAEQNNNVNFVLLLKTKCSIFGQEKKTPTFIRSVFPHFQNMPCTSEWVQNFL